MLRLLLLLLLAVLLPGCTAPFARKAVWLHEAEDAALIGKTYVAHEQPDGSGRGFVTGFVAHGDALDFTVRVPADGFYFLDIAYAAGADKRIPVYVNGRAQGSRHFPKTTGFTEARYGRVILNQGDNTVRIGTDWGYADIDFIRISAADDPAAFQLANAPVNPRASPEARALFSQLTSSFGVHTFAGQHDSTPRSLDRLTHIKSLTAGQVPALLGLDLLYYSPTWKLPKGDGAIEVARDWALRQQGIVTLSWHWFSPDGQGDPIWSSFSTTKTTFDVSRIEDANSPEYAAMVRGLDHVAEQLKVLRDARVPVLWRPLHEAEGGWFWWGARGPAPTKALYRLMFDRFTRIHGLDNLLWVWTTTDDTNAREWYPGDDYVDIIGADLYFPAGTEGDFFTVFDQLRERYAGRKPIALSECGVLPTPSADAPWLWFLAWDDLIARVDMNPADAVARTYQHPRTITLERLRRDPDTPKD